MKKVWVLMNKNVPLQSVFRQPMRSLFLIILIALVSFAFVSKVVEYVVVQRETERLGGTYRSIGRLEKLDGDEYGNISQGANLILESPHLAYEDRRRVSSGVMQGVWNPDLKMSGIDQNDMWFYGTLTKKASILKKGGLETSETVGYTLTFNVDKVLAGYPEDVVADKPISLLFLSQDQADAIPKIDSMEIGQRYLIRGWKEFRFNIDPSWQNASSSVQIKALDDAEVWYIPVEVGHELDLTVPSMAGIKNHIDILNENHHALLLYGTTDMSALPQMQETSRLYYLVDGRWLNHQDDLNERQVIVIQKDFASASELKVGDTISMTLRGLKYPISAYIQGKDRENWRSYPTYEETFEIVGIYDDLVGLSSFHYIYAYVPYSMLPVNVIYPDEILYPENYSFVLDSSQHQEKFINQLNDPLAQLGFGLNFVENNGATFWAAVTPLRRSALFGLLIYTLALLLTLALSVFLYLSQRQKDYAILRALGVPKKKANRQIILPIMLIAAAGVIAGGIPAWNYALDETAKTISQLPTRAGELPDATLNIIVLGSIGLGVLLLVLCFSLAGISRLARKPVLEMLGRAAPAGNMRRQTRTMQQTISTLQPGVITVSPAMAEGGLVEQTPQVPFDATNQTQPGSKTGYVGKIAEARALVRFGLRYISRNSLKSFLTILAAMVFIFALGWMQWSMDKNLAEVDHLYNSIVVEAEIVKSNASLITSGGDGIIAERTIKQALDSGFIQSAYLEAAAAVNQVISPSDPGMAQDVDYSILAFDQPESFFKTLSTRDTVKYAYGWDEDLFSTDWNMAAIRRNGVPAVFPESILSQFNLNLGEVIYLAEESGTVYPYHVVGKYVGGPRQYSGGIIKSGGEPILLPLSALRVIQDNHLYYVTAKFVIDPAKNRELPAFKEEMTKVVSVKGAGRLPLKIHFWDEELSMVVEPMEKNLTLLEVLYPVAMGVSTLISAGLCLLMALLQARDIALLRMLGVTKTRVRALLSSEGILLSLVGVLLGLGLVGLPYHDIGVVLDKAMSISAGLYLLGALIGSLIGAFSVSNRKPLDLLQVKE